MPWYLKSTILFSLYLANYNGPFQIMNKSAELMSKKEKDYIAFCFSKSFYAFKTDIDYSSILNGTMVDYDFSQEKKEFKLTFGKPSTRSRKHSRISASTTIPLLEADFAVLRFIEILITLKYINLDKQSRSELENNAIAHFKDHFSVLANNEKVFDRLEEFVTILPHRRLLEFMNLLFDNCQHIQNESLLFDFFDKNFDVLPEFEYSDCSNLWNYRAGYVLGLFLIIKNRKLLDHIIESFLESQPLDCECMHKLVEVLMSLGDASQKADLKKKMENSGFDLSNN